MTLQKILQQSVRGATLNRLLRILKLHMNT